MTSQFDANCLTSMTNWGLFECATTFGSKISMRYDSREWEDRFRHYARKKGRHAFRELSAPAYAKFTVPFIAFQNVSCQSKISEQQAGVQWEDRPQKESNG